jgi:hypothetical protein
LQSVFTKKDLEILIEKYEDEIVTRKKEIEDAGKPSGSTETTAPAKPTSPVPEETKTDGDLSAVSKFIPGIPVAIFTSTLPLLKGAADTTPVDLLSYGVFGFCLFLTVVMTLYEGTNEKVKLPYLDTEVEIPGKYIKTTLSSIAFIIWAFNIEAFIMNIENYDPVIGNMALLGFTLGVPYLYRILPKGIIK